KPIEVSPELLFVLSRAQALSKQSDGAFDVTVGPLVQLWRKARRTKRRPAPADIEAARKLVGYERVRIDAERKTVELQLAGMRLDLGGIAKGYAADEALKALKKHGLSRALVAAAGDIAAGDPPPGQAGWRVGLGRPDDPDAHP